MGARIQKKLLIGGLMEKWIYNNMDRFGNCLIPDEIIEKLGSEKVIKDLEKHCGRKVVIEYVCSNITFNNNKRSKLSRYIAKEV